MKGLHQVFFVLCGALLILSRPTAAGEDELVILESEGPIIVEDIPIRLGGPWKRLVALNSLISIESSPHHYMPIGAYFITIVASHVPVHFNVTLGVVPVAGKGVLVPAEGDILTKRLHRLYPHPFAIFNTTVSMMGVYKLVVFIEDDTDIYVEMVYQLKRAGVRAFQEVAIEPLREEIIGKERAILKEMQDTEKDKVRKYGSVRLNSFAQRFEKWSEAEREKVKDMGEEDIEAAKSRIKEKGAEMQAELDRLDGEAEKEYSELLELQKLRAREVGAIAQRYVSRLVGTWPPGYTAEELDARRLEIEALAERIRLWGLSHARLRQAYFEEPEELKRLGARLSGAYELENEANGNDASNVAASNKKDDVELTYYRRIREFAHSRLGRTHPRPMEWPESEHGDVQKQHHRHGKESHNVTVVAASRPFRVLPATQCNGAPWHKEVKCDDCVSALRFQCAWCDTLDACVLSDGVGPLDRHACPEFHLQQCIVEGSRIIIVVPMVVGVASLLLIIASCCYCEMDVKRRVRQRQQRRRELNHVHSDNYPSYGTIVQRE